MYVSFQGVPSSALREICLLKELKNKNIVRLGNIYRLVNKDTNVVLLILAWILKCIDISHFATCNFFFLHIYSPKAISVILFNTATSLYLNSEGCLGSNTVFKNQIRLLVRRGIEKLFLYTRSRSCSGCLRIERI